MPPRNDPQGRVHELLEEWLDAIRQKDIERLMGCYAPDMVAYDMMPPLEWRGADSYRAAWEHGLSMPGSFEIELYEPMIVANDDVALVFALAYFRVEPPEHAATDGWFRWTAGLSRTDGGWTIVHEHSSVPCDMDSGQARLDLRP